MRDDPARPGAGIQKRAPGGAPGRDRARDELSVASRSAIDDGGTCSRASHDANTR